MGRYLRYLLNWGLLLSSTVVIVTGLVADWWGLSRMRTHIWAGYLFTVLILAHVLLNTRSLFTWPRLVPRPQPTRLSLRPAPARPVQERRVFLRGAAVGLIGGLVGGYLTPLLFNIRPRVDDLSQAYHRWSSVTLRGALWSALRWGRPPAQYKVYPDAPRVPLPPPRDLANTSLMDVINRRRSLRDYVQTPLPLEDLATLLHSAQGITEPTYPKRASPSAGALYPLEVYIAVHRVDGLEPGLYHYAVREHALEQLRAGNMQRPLMVACLDQEHAQTAAVVFILSAIFQRERWKYQGRAYRYVLIEAGHVGQNLYLTATALGLGCCAIGAFYDDALNDLLGVDGEREAALYVLTVGKPLT